MVNGICQRADALAVLRSLPIGVIPAGSGNGLAACLDQAEPNSATFAVICGIIAIIIIDHCMLEIC